MPAGPIGERDRPTPALLSFLFVLLILIVYADPLFVRRNFGGRDLLGYHLPIEKAVHDAYARGRWPVWITEISGGRPLLANLNVGALYPVRPLLSPIPFPLAMRIYPLLHWALAGLGLMALLATVGASPSASWVGAGTYVFSGILVSQTFYTNTQPGVTLLPWIVWSVARPARTSAGRIGLSSLLLGLDFLAGDVFTTGLALLAALLWILLEGERASRLSALASFGVSAILAGLLALPQFVATLLWIPETQRAVTGMKLGEALRFSVPPWRLFEFLIPYPFGRTWAAEPRATWAPPAFGGLHMGFFSTLYAGPFAACAALLVWRRRGRGLRFTRALLLAALAICVLPSLAPAAWSTWRAPLPLRYPEKMAVGLTLAAALFAGMGFDQLRAEKRLRRWPLAVGVVLALAAAASALAPRAAGQLATATVAAEPSLAPVAALHLPGALAEGGLLWMVAVLAIDLLRRPGRVPLVAAALLVSLAPIAATRRIAQSFRKEQILGPSAFARALERRDPERAFRALGEAPYIPPSRFESAQMSSDVSFLDFPRRNWFYFTPVLWSRGVVFNADFDAGDLSRVESLRRFSFSVASFPDPASFFGSVCVKFGIRFPDQPLLRGFRRFGGNRFEAWDENPQAQPDIRLLERWKEEPGALPALRDMLSLAPGEVTLETGVEGRRSARRGTLRILEKSPEALRVETDSPDPTFLFVLRGFWSQRSVTVDRDPAAVVPAQLAFSAVPVPAGRHRVDWVENVPGGSFSRWGPVLYAAVLLGLWARERRREPVNR